MHTVEEAMTTEVVTVSPEAPVTVAARLMRDTGVSGLPVVDREGRVVGIVTEADLLHRAVLPELEEVLSRRRGSSESVGATVADVMSRDVVGVRRDDPLAKAARLMETARVRRLVVVGDGFTLEGIISRSNVVAALGRSDAAIEDEIRSRVITGILELEPDAVTVSAQDGIVSLTGEVTHRREAIRLQRLAGRVLGVSRVDSAVAWHIDDVGHIGRMSGFASFAKGRASARDRTSDEENPGSSEERRSE